jgi:hypothetical protein
MGCQEDGAIVTDLVERFVRSDANQSAVEERRLHGRRAADHQPDVVAAAHVTVIVRIYF